MDNSEYLVSCVIISCVVHVHVLCKYNYDDRVIVTHD